MIRLERVSKAYRTGGITTVALDGVSLNFRKREFVAILGMSGSGKTTCLNLIGGLDRSDSGDIVIKGKSTRNFSEGDWDAYRNNSVGFVFQSFNLILHQSIVANVALGMTLSGVSRRESRRRARDLLVRVGLEQHLHKKPGQLSGGQMQRVAVARALANDPEVLLCDEPTGSLDSATSVQIMDLIRETAGDRLVIMVTHHAGLAEKYADRVIRFEDGRVVSDSRPFEPQGSGEDFRLKKTAMGFATALRLSFENLWAKKGRAFLTAFASGIGIIGIALILSLSNGFQRQIDLFQRDAMAEFPLIIPRAAMTMDREQMAALRERMAEQISGRQSFAQSAEVYPAAPRAGQTAHINRFSDEFLAYLRGIDPKICEGISFLRSVTFNAVRRVEGRAVPVSFGSGLSSRSAMAPHDMPDMGALGLSVFPESLGGQGTGYLRDNYELLYGDYPAAATDLALVVDAENQVRADRLRDLGFDATGGIPFSEIAGMELRIVHNDDFFVKTALGTYAPGSDYEAMYASEKAVPVRVSGILRLRPGVRVGLLGDGIAYSDALAERVLREVADSQAARAQRESGLLSLFQRPGFPGSAEPGEEAGPAPSAILLYPASFEAKDAVKAYLDAYNSGRGEKERIVYTDLSEAISRMTGGILTGITAVLIAFSSVALFVSLIMIGIITYTSVLERTREIGVLRALGARRRDITRVFDAETFILGLLSGLLGITAAALLILPANAVLLKITGLSGVARLRPSHAALLWALSVALTVLGGHLPARMAARKDAVVALRSE